MLASTLVLVFSFLWISKEVALHFQLWLELEGLEGVLTLYCSLSVAERFSTDSHGALMLLFFPQCQCIIHHTTNLTFKSAYVPSWTWTKSANQNTVSHSKLPCVSVSNMGSYLAFLRLGSPLNRSVASPRLFSDVHCSALLR